MLHSAEAASVQQPPSPTSGPEALPPRLEYPPHPSQQPASSLGEYLLPAHAPEAASPPSRPRTAERSTPTSGE